MNGETLQDPKEQSAQANSVNHSNDDEMARYNITHQTVDVFFWGKYRYSTLTDAISQAKRDEHLKQT